MSGPKNSDAVAEVLREHPPQLDDIARARIEKRLLDATNEPGRGAAAEAPRSRTSTWIGGGLAVAAAAALAWFAFGRGAPEDTGRVAHMELRHSGALRQSGTIDEGSTLRTEADEVATIRVEDSEVRLAPGTELRIDALTDDQMAFSLVHGEIQVEFHPRARGEEGMHVSTARARVEVVGTVFAVTETQAATEVAVSEGRVRVVPVDGEPRFVSAGESTRVGPEPRAEAPPQPPAAPVAVAESPEPASEEAAPEAPSPRAHMRREENLRTSAQLLARARRLQAEGQSDEARRLFREAVGAPGASPPTRAQAYSELGDLLGGTADYAGATEAYESAARQGAGHLSHMAIYALARMQERRMHDAAAARVTYHRFLDAGAGPLTGTARAALCRLGEADQCPEGATP